MFPRFKKYFPGIRENILAKTAAASRHALQLIKLTLVTSTDRSHLNISGNEMVFDIWHPFRQRMRNRWVVAIYTIHFDEEGGPSPYSAFDWLFLSADDWRANVVQYATFDFVTHGNKKQEVPVALWLWYFGSAVIPCALGVRCSNSAVVDRFASPFLVGH